MDGVGRATIGEIKCHKKRLHPPIKTQDQKLEKHGDDLGVAHEWPSWIGWEAIKQVWLVDCSCHDNMQETKESGNFSWIFFEI